MKYEDVTRLLQCHDKILMDKELFLMDKQKYWLVDMEGTPDEEPVKIVEMTTFRISLRLNL